MLKRLDDKEWPVRHQLAASLGVMPAAARDQAVVTLLDRNGDDPITLDAALSGLRGNELAVLERLLQVAGGATPQREAAVTMIAATVARGAQDAAVQKLLGAIGDESRPAWQRAALLRGAEVALLGAAMPGTAGRRAAVRPRRRTRPVRPVPAGGPVPVARMRFRRLRGRRPRARRPLRLNTEPVVVLGARRPRAASWAAAPRSCWPASSGPASRARRRRSRR